jgi:hypothetical protein
MGGGNQPRSSVWLPQSVVGQAYPPNVAALTPTVRCILAFSVDTEKKCWRGAST